MAEEKSIRVSENLFVNEATLELVQRRIETEVKSGFWRWVGIPVGGGGIVVVLFALFWQIPQYVENYLKSEPGEKVVMTQVNSSVKDYFATRDGQKAIQDHVKKVLEPQLASALEPIKEKAEQLVRRAESLTEVRGINKDTYGELDLFLRSHEAARLKEGPALIALTARIRQTDRGGYNFNVMMDYLDSLQQEFGPKFQHVLLTDSEGLIARIDPSLFRTGLQQHRNILMRILNEPQDRLPRNETQDKLDQIFGVRVSDAILESWKVGIALRKSMWRDPPYPQKEVAVLGEDGHFIGTTTRERLLAFIFSEAPKEK